MLGFVATASGCAALGEVVAGPIPPEYYLALRSDAKAANDSLSEGSWMGVGKGLVFLADMPVSAVFGTVMLPNVFLARLTWEENKPKEQAEKSDKQPEQEVNSDLQPTHTLPTDDCATNK